MSISLFYPENQKIALRVAGIVDGITSLESQLADIDDDLSKLNDDLRAKLKEYAKKEGIMSVRDARDALAKIVPKDVMDHVDEFLASRTEKNERVGNIFEGVLIGALVIGRIKSVITLTEALRMCSLMAILEDTIKGLRLMCSASTFTEGLAMIRGLPGAINTVAKMWEEVNEGSRWLLVAQWGQRLSAVIEVLGLALDSVLIIVAAIEGAKQKEALISTLRDVYIRRILVKKVILDAAIPLSWTATVSSIVTLLQYNVASTEAVDALEKTVLDGMTAAHNQITFQYTYDLMKKQDDAAGVYSDYDPKPYDEVLKYAQSLDNDVVGSNSTALVLLSAPGERSLDKPDEAFQMATLPRYLFETTRIQPAFLTQTNVEQLMLANRRPQPTMTIRAMDLFWPDNPNRKRRAQELYDDIQWIKAQLDDIEKQIKTIGSDLKPNLDAAMKAMGFATLSDLEAQIEKVCSAPDLERWKNAKSVMDKTDQIQATVFGVIQIGAVAVGVIGIAVSFAFPPAGAALIEIATLTGIVSEILKSLLEIIEGAVIRDECRRAISELGPGRIRARVAYERMEIMIGWMRTVNDVMRVFEKGMSREEAAKVVGQLHLVSQGLAVKFNSFGEQDARHILMLMDIRRGSWMEEDWF